MDGVEKDRRTTKLGTFVLKRLDKAATFVCDHCKKENTSKNVSEFTPAVGSADKLSDVPEILCNGCHGELLAKG
jgi:hypothetical protein